MRIKRLKRRNFVRRKKLMLIIYLKFKFSLYYDILCLNYFINLFNIKEYIDLLLQK